MTRRNLCGFFALLLLAAVGCGDMDSGSTADSSGGTWDPNAGGNANSGGGTTIGTGGAQDFGFFRQLLDAGQIPRSSDIDDQGFFAEHHTSLPSADCGELVCVHAMLGVMGNLINGADCTVLQLGLNSPITPEDLPRLPMNLAIVVDVSGSMDTGNKLTFVREGLHTLLDALHDEDTVTIVTYANRAEIALAATEVGDNRFAIRQVVDRLVAGGGTNFYDGLELGYEQVMARHSGELQNRLMILSDGQPTAGITGSDAIINMSRNYNLEGVGLTTIGVGTDFNEALMRELAEQGDGNFYFVESQAAIEEVFVEEVETFTVAIAEDLELALNPGTAYRIRGVFGTSIWEDEGRGGVIRIPSVFLAHRTAHDDNESGRRGGGSALLIELMADDSDPTAISSVGDISLSYFPRVGLDGAAMTEGGSLVTVDANIMYPGQLEQDLETGYFSHQAIAKNFVMLNIFAGFQMASDLFHQGAMDEALATIESLASNVEQMNLELGDEDLADDLRLLNQYAQNLRAQGAGQVPEPPAEEPWPRD